MLTRTGVCQCIRIYYQEPRLETEIPIATEQTTIDFTLAKFQIDAIAGCVQVRGLAFGSADGAEGLLQIGKHSCILSLGAAGIIIVPAFFLALEN